MSVELSAVIGQLREELSQAMEAGEGEELRFELGPVELELSVSVTKEAGAAGKVRFWVAEVGADGKASSATTQRLRLTLDPRRTDQPDRRPWVSGQGQSGER